mmetsp:Transcript_53631/g.166197  ORF Transcript_53631/g.166197 Transcript_53631/m.166197 type:complete len:256 (+) Transcript_53631:247-1014(+)
MWRGRLRQALRALRGIRRRRRQGAAGGPGQGERLLLRGPALHLPDLRDQLRVHLLMRGHGRVELGLQVVDLRLRLLELRVLQARGLVVGDMRLRRKVLELFDLLLRAVELRRLVLQHFQDAADLCLRLLELERLHLILHGLHVAERNHEEALQGGHLLVAAVQLGELPEQLGGCRGLCRKLAEDGLRLLLRLLQPERVRVHQLADVPSLGLQAPPRRAREIVLLHECLLRVGGQLLPLRPRRRVRPAAAVAADHC